MRRHRTLHNRITRILRLTTHRRTKPILHRRHSHSMMTLRNLSRNLQSRTRLRHNVNLASPPTRRTPINISLRRTLFSRRISNLTRPSQRTNHIPQRRRLTLRGQMSRLTRPLSHTTPRTPIIRRTTHSPHQNHSRIRRIITRMQRRRHLTTTHTSRITRQITSTLSRTRLLSMNSSHIQVRIHSHSTVQVQRSHSRHTRRQRQNTRIKFTRHITQHQRRHRHNRIRQVSIHNLISTSRSTINRYQSHTNRPHQPFIAHKLQLTPTKHNNIRIHLRRSQLTRKRHSPSMTLPRRSRNLRRTRRQLLLLQLTQRLTSMTPTLRRLLMTSMSQLRRSQPPQLTRMTLRNSHRRTTPQLRRTTNTQTPTLSRMLRHSTTHRRLNRMLTRSQQMRQINLRTTTRRRNTTATRRQPSSQRIRISTNNSIQQSRPISMRLMKGRRMISITTITQSMSSLIPQYSLLSHIRIIRQRTTMRLIPRQPRRRKRQTRSQIQVINHSLPHVLTNTTRHLIRKGTFLSHRLLSHLTRHNNVRRIISRHTPIQRIKPSSNNTSTPRIHTRRPLNLTRNPLKQRTLNSSLTRTSKPTRIRSHITTIRRSQRRTPRTPSRSPILQRRRPRPTLNPIQHTTSRSQRQRRLRIRIKINHSHHRRLQRTLQLHRRSAPTQRRTNTAQRNRRHPQPIRPTTNRQRRQQQRPNITANLLRSHSITSTILLRRMTSKRIHNSRLTQTLKINLSPSPQTRRVTRHTPPPENNNNSRTQRTNQGSTRPFCIANPGIRRLLARTQAYNRPPSTTQSATSDISFTCRQPSHTAESASGSVNLPDDSWLALAHTQSPSYSAASIQARSGITSAKGP